MGEGVFWNELHEPAKQSRCSNGSAAVVGRSVVYRDSSLRAG